MGLQQVKNNKSRDSVINKTEVSLYRFSCISFSSITPYVKFLKRIRDKGTPLKKTLSVT
jgi:hypothetical protein